MARARVRSAGGAIEEFVIRELTEADDEGTTPSVQIISVRVDPQTVGELEDLAGRLDITRSMLARRLIETGLEEAEAAYQRFLGGKG